MAYRSHELPYDSHLSFGWGNGDLRHAKAPGEKGK